MIKKELYEKLGRSQVLRDSKQFTLH